MMKLFTFHWLDAEKHVDSCLQVAAQDSAEACAAFCKLNPEVIDFRVDSGGDVAVVGVGD